MAEKNKKPDIAKQAQRKFYKVFNDKSALRRIAFSMALVATPSYMISQALQEDPSKIRGPEAQAHVQQYVKEIADIQAAIPKDVFVYNDSKSFFHTPAPRKMTPEEAKKMGQLNDKAKDLVTRVTFDRQLSEYDVGKISYTYRDTLHKQIPMKSFEAVAGYRSAYVQDYREKAIAEKAPEVTATAENILDNSASKTSTEGSLYGVVVFWVLFDLFERAVKKGLKHGRRRDDDNIHEENVEKFDQAKEDLQNILKPRGSKPPAP